MLTDNTFGKTICSICYEDLKPIVEDLQSISICGHVFHELCLQQWFEYCSNGKKYSCPVCKQSCSANNAGRLYFQSLGDQNDSVISQIVIGRQEDPEVLRREVKGLEVKVAGLSSALERQGKELRETNEELCLCKEQLKQEVALKSEALKQKASIQQLLHLKSEELDKATLECLRMQERNIALAKELASLKLVSDLNLVEDEVLKLASFGNEANNKDTIDILKKSLVIRNQSYKELMAKCNLLGRGQARSCKKLEKAKEKMDKLKTRIQELETAVEVQDNEVLRALKVSKKTSCKGVVLNCVNENSNTLSTNNFSSKDRTEQFFVGTKNLGRTGSLKNDPSCSTKREKFNSIDDTGAGCTKESISTMAINKERNAYVLVDEDTSKFSTAVNGLSNLDLKHQTRDDNTQKSPLARLEAFSDTKKKPKVHGCPSEVGLSDSKTSINSDEGNTFTAAVNVGVTSLLDDITEVQPVLNLKKESPFPLPLSKPGDICFSGGLLGPDGTNRYLGKWCKRGRSTGSVAMKGSSTSSGDLIAVGSDGRGGRVKVLRSLNQSSLDGQEALVSAKRCKHGAKTSSLQSQGCLQIDHFFGRVSH